MDFIDRYLEGAWLKYAVAVMTGAIFGNFTPNAIPACVVFLPVALALILLGRWNDREWPFQTSESIEEKILRKETYAERARRDFVIMNRALSRDNEKPRHQP